jgi:hypothetical protein
VLSGPKTGKTGTAAMHVLTTTLVYGGCYAEGYCVANDFEQAQGIALGMACHAATFTWNQSTSLNLLSAG